MLEPFLRALLCFALLHAPPDPGTPAGKLMPGKPQTCSLCSRLLSFHDCDPRDPPALGTELVPEFEHRGENPDLAFCRDQQHLAFSAGGLPGSPELAYLSDVGSHI